VFEREIACLLEVSLVEANEVVLVSWWTTWVVEQEFRPLPIHMVDDNDDPNDLDFPDDNDNTMEDILLGSILLVVAVGHVAVGVSWPILLLGESIWEHNSHGVVVEDKTHNDREVEDLETPHDLVEEVVVDDRTVHVPRGAIFDTRCCCRCCIEKDDNTEAVEATASWRVVSDPIHGVAVVGDPCHVVHAVHVRNAW
jgi:hypothetical protein